MDSYYTSSRVMTMTLIVMAGTCLYVAYSHLEQARILKQARDDFAWWLLFTKLEKSPGDYEALRHPKQGEKPVFYFDYSEEIGFCLLKQKGTTVDAEISSKTFNMAVIEPSFYARVDDMPFWIRSLDLSNYEPTKLTDSVFALLKYANTNDGGSLSDKDLLPTKFGLEALKRIKKLRTESQFFSIETADSDKAPRIYRKIQKKFESQTIKVPALELDFKALQAVWIIAVISTLMSVAMRNQLAILKKRGLADIQEPWLIFDADSTNSRILAGVWITAFCLSPILIFGTLTSLQYSSALIDGPASSVSVNVGAGLVIALLGTVSCLETFGSFKLLVALRGKRRQQRHAEK